MTKDNYPNRQTCNAVTTCRTHLSEGLSSGDVVFGFDGYIDNVRKIDRNASQHISTLDEFGKEVTTSASANSSLSVSWEQEGQRTGGHVSHLSQVFQGLGFNPTMFGMCGEPLLDTFKKEFTDCTIYSLGKPGTTDAIEFDDGKLMLMESGGAAKLEWKLLKSKVGIDTLVNELNGAQLFGVGYWSMIPALAGIFDGLLKDVFPKLSTPPKHMLLDPANIREMEEEKLDEVVSAISRFDDLVEVTVSANRFETKVLASKLGNSQGESIVNDARIAFEVLGVDRFVGHSPTTSVVVSEEGCTSVAVPQVKTPKLTTSAGDHFNAGLALGLLEGFPDNACVALGNALASEFVRSGKTPSYSDIKLAVESYGERFD